MALFVLFLSGVSLGLFVGALASKQEPAENHHIVTFAVLFLTGMLYSIFAIMK